MNHNSTNSHCKHKTHAEWFCQPLYRTIIQFKKKKKILYKWVCVLFFLCNAVQKMYIFVMFIRAWVTGHGRCCEREFVQLWACVFACVFLPLLLCSSYKQMSNVFFVLFGGGWGRGWGASCVSDMLKKCHIFDFLVSYFLILCTYTFIRRWFSLWNLKSESVNL